MVDLYRYDECITKYKVCFICNQECDITSQMCPFCAKVVAEQKPQQDDDYYYSSPTEKTMNQEDSTQPNNKTQEFHISSLNRLPRKRVVNYSFLVDQISKIAECNLQQEQSSNKKRLRRKREFY
jgi:hypothetical protein